ncbi:Solute carrier family 15 member 1 [Ophiophagus hannah]|uniref:Solute carrier family 15 member 1 n=1 Tax=Ophiophagus hannah TaxID=8665 RepID=V8NSZ0_OPHHA|nr:Solute carrier family 15 member 1 [Ophiophagus hannah]
MEESKGKHRAGCFGYPLSIFFIVINEFCERFSYYGMRAVLVLYFKFFLHWDDNLSTAIYHTFVALCYLTPILGALIADSWLGKFKTIISLSIVYTIGQVVLSISSINDLMDGNHDGVADDINIPIALSMIGLVLIALGTGGIKPCVAAFGGDQFEEDQEKQRSRFFSIFYLSINAGSLLSTIITPILRVVFIIGSRMYKKVKPEGNIMVQVCKCISFAIRNRFKHRSKQFPKREHWLDWATEKYDKRLITEVKMVLKVLFLYIPLPMFWALFDQQGSRWTLQATTMDGNFGSVQIQPDQMQTVNPILIVLMVPIVDVIIYPLIKKCHINFTPLRKMTVGMLLAALAFVVAAVVQIGIDTEYITYEMKSSNNIDISYINGSLTEKMINMGKQRHTLVIKDNPKIETNLFIDGITEKPEQGNNMISLDSVINIIMGDVAFGELRNFSVSNYTAFPSGSNNIIVKLDNEVCTAPSMSFGYGSAYTIIVTGCTGKELNIEYIEDIQANTISMAWQIPQYFIMTSAEVVFSVTGLEFSYSQAPTNMKSVLQAGWLLTVAFGNIIVLIIAGASKLDEQWAEYVLFAALLFAVTIIFAVMAYFYTYVDPAEVEAQFAEEDEKKKEKDQLEKEKHIYENEAGSELQTKM